MARRVIKDMMDGMREDAGDSAGEDARASERDPKKPIVKRIRVLEWRAGMIDAWLKMTTPRGSKERNFWINRTVDRHRLGAERRALDIAIRALNKLRREKKTGMDPVLLLGDVLDEPNLSPGIREKIELFVEAYEGDIDEDDES